MEYQLKLTDSLNYLLGRYITWAFNDPKNYPKEPYLSRKHESKRVQTDEEMERQARLLTMAWGGEIINASNDNR